MKKIYILDRFNDLTDQIYRRKEFLYHYQNSPKFRSFLFRTIEIDEKSYFQVEVPNHKESYPSISFVFYRQFINEYTWQGLEFKKFYGGGIYCWIHYCGHSYMEGKDDYLVDVRFFQRIRLERFLIKNKYSVDEIHNWVDYILMILL